MNHSVAHDALKLSIMKGLSLIIGLCSVMMLSRFRALAEYGSYSQIIMIVTLAVSLFALGLPNSLNYFLASAENEKYKVRFISSYYTFCTLLSIITGLVLLFSVPFLCAYFKNASLATYSYALFLLPWTRIISSSLENYLVVEKKTSLLFIVKIVYSSVTLLVIIASIVLELDFIKYMISFVICEVVFTIICYYIVKKVSRGCILGIELELVKRILKFSLPLGLASVVGTLTLELDKLMVGFFCNTETLAIYTNAARELPVTIISASITAVLMPRLVRMLKAGDSEEAFFLWGSATYLSYIFICFFAVVLVVFAPQIISLLYSDKYLPGVAVFRVYALVLLFRTTYFGMILNSIGKTKIIFVCSLVTLVLNAILNFVLYYSIGIVGFAIATLVSIGAVNGIQLKISANIYQKSIRSVMPWKKLIWVTLVNIVFGVSVYWIVVTLQLDTSLIQIIFAIILGLFWTVGYLFVVKKDITRTWRILNSV